MCLFLLFILFLRWDMTQASKFSSSAFCLLFRLFLFQIRCSNLSEGLIHCLECRRFQRAPESWRASPELRFLFSFFLPRRRSKLFLNYMLKKMPVSFSARTRPLCTCNARGEGSFQTVQVSFSCSEVSEMHVSPKHGCLQKRSFNFSFSFCIKSGRGQNRRNFLFRAAHAPKTYDWSISWNTKLSCFQTKSN